MDKIFEQCAIDGELTPELIKRKQELDSLMEVELSEIEAGYGNMWVPKERQYADVRQKYDDIWEQELNDAGYIVRPMFEDWYADLWKEPETKSTQSLKEGRSSAEIKAEIRKLMRELRDAERAEAAQRSMSVAATPAEAVPTEEPDALTEVWVWDIYLTPKDKGKWTSLENDNVYRTEKDALNAAWTLLNELDGEGELFDENGGYCDPDDYYVEAYSVPIESVDPKVLEWSKL